MVTYFRSNLALGAVLVGSMLLASCGGDDNGGTQPSTTGSVTVTVTADGSPQAGVSIQRYEPGGTTPVGARDTDGNGRATFPNLEAGAWEMEILVPSGFVLASGETARKNVTVVAEQTAAVAFAIVDDFTGETVEASDALTFSRPTLTISAGTAVRWVNVGSMLHTVTPDGHSEWTSTNLSNNGDTFIHTFDTPGTYEYFCQPHVGAGMRGTVIVN
jgi:plastocyanin